jgi:hypothetical protein
VPDKERIQSPTGAALSGFVAEVESIANVVHILANEFINDPHRLRAAPLGLCDIWRRLPRALALG